KCRQVVAKADNPPLRLRLPLDSHPAAGGREQRHLGLGSVIPLARGTMRAAVAIARGRSFQPIAIAVPETGATVLAARLTAGLRRSTAAAAAVTAAGEIEFGGSDAVSRRQRDPLADQRLDRGDRLAVFRCRQRKRAARIAG